MSNIEIKVKSNLEREHIAYHGEEGLERGERTKSSLCIDECNKTAEEVFKNSVIKRLLNEIQRIYDIKQIYKLKASD